MDAQTTLEHAPRAGAVFVRLTPEQYLRVVSDATILGKTLPEVLRDGYFVGPRIQPLLSAEDQRTLLVSLSRIGNNMNQIARRLNSGGHRGIASGELSSLYEDLAALRVFFTSKYCRCGEEKSRRT